MNRRSFMKTVGIGLVALALPARSLASVDLIKEHRERSFIPTCSKIQEFTVSFPDGDKYVFMGKMDDLGHIKSVDGEFECTCEIKETV